MNSVRSTVPTASAFLGEAMGTFLLVFTVIMTAIHPKSIAQNIAPIAIGWSVLLAHLILIPTTGCGINPARSLGPMLVVLAAGGKAGLKGWWVFYTAPFIGYVSPVAYYFLFFLDVSYHFP
jgi:glycerol uptake facilitator-like aquaporin